MKKPRIPKQPAQLPQQKIEMPRIEPAPRVEFDMDGWAGLPKRMERTADFLCTIEWSWSPANERMDSYYLQRGRTHWILWRKDFDDNYGQWEKPTAKARCLRKGLGEQAAAMILLAAVLAEDLRRYDPDVDRFHAITSTGLLSIGAIDAVADTVWGDQR